jgi:integrase
MRKKARRPRETGGLWKRPGSRFWWISYGGVKESTKTTVKADAERLLRARLQAKDAGALPRPGKPVTVAELEVLVQNDHDVNGRRTDTTSFWKHLRRLLGDDTRARDVSEATVAAYKAKRLGEGAAPGSVSVELSWLRRGLKLAVKMKQLAVAPEVTGLRGNVRTGFLEWEQVKAVCAHLPAHLADVVRFLFWSSWRKSEAIGCRATARRAARPGLLWSQVDRRRREIRIEQTKTGAPRELPYGALPALVEIVERRWAAAEALRARGVLRPQVFLREDGSEIKDGHLLSAWRRATVAAGLPGRIVHDLRRSGARNMLRHGVPMTVAKDIGGWKSLSMFQRYAITDTAVMREALAKLARD